MVVAERLELSTYRLSSDCSGPVELHNHWWTFGIRTRTSALVCLHIKRRASEVRFNLSLLSEGDDTIRPNKLVEAVGFEPTVSHCANRFKRPD